MLKIGILTFHFSDNYGALFQAYSLKYYLDSKGYDVEFVNYHPDYIEKGSSISLSKPFSKSNLKILYLFFSRILNYLFSPRNYLSKMEGFRKDVLEVSGSLLKEGSDIGEACSQYDVLICGSDQIWNPSVQYGVDPVYFLSFTSRVAARCISYAPSFGSDNVDLKYYEEMSILLEGLDGISIREKSGAKIVKELIGYVPKVVPDPTLLMTSFEHIIKKPEGYELSKPYCFLYNLRSNDGVPEACDFLRDNIGLEIIEVHNPHRRWKKSGSLIYPSPGEWLYLNKHSDVVLTNSFHGVALSIVNNKNFIYMPLKGIRQKMNARAFNLLESVGLESRIVGSVEEVSDVYHSTINWSSVNKKVVELRQSGAVFLQEQIDFGGRSE